MRPNFRSHNFFVMIFSSGEKIEIFKSKLMRWKSCGDEGGCSGDGGGCGGDVSDEGGCGGDVLLMETRDGGA